RPSPGRLASAAVEAELLDDFLVCCERWAMWRGAVGDDAERGAAHVQEVDQGVVGRTGDPELGVRVADVVDQWHGAVWVAAANAASWSKLHRDEVAVELAHCHGSWWAGLEAGVVAEPLGDRLGCVGDLCVRPAGAVHCRRLDAGPHDNGVGRILYLAKWHAGRHQREVDLAVLMVRPPAARYRVRQLGLE